MIDGLISEDCVHVHDEQPATDLTFPYPKFITIWMDGEETCWLRGPLKTCLPLYKDVKEPTFGVWNKVKVAEGEFAGYTGMYRILEKEDLH